MKSKDVALDTTDGETFVPLFVYGELENHSPKLIACRGELRLRDDDAAARFGSEYKTLVWGQVHWVATETLERVAEFEKPEYDLVKVKSVDGRVLYAFEDVEDGWEDEMVVPSGRYEDAGI